MPIYNIHNSNLNEIDEKPFKREKDMRLLCNANLNELMELTVVRNEFSIHGMRIDTLAYNEQTKAFIIIEYKVNKHYSVIDQGFAYLNLLLNIMSS